MRSLHVSNLHHSVSEELLLKIFSKTGRITGITLLDNLAEATVDFCSHEEARRALETLDFEPIAGVPCRIMWSSRRAATPLKSGTKTVFFKNLEKSIDNEMLFDTFSVLGGIVSCKVPTDANGCSKGFGFVQFESEESAAVCLKKVNGMLMDGQITHVGQFLSKKAKLARMSERPFTSLFVKNFPTSLDDGQLADMFRRFGSVSASKVARFDSGLGKGYGFLVFAEPQSAAKALIEMNESLTSEGHLLRVSPVDVKLKEKTAPKSTPIVDGKIQADSRVDLRTSKNETVVAVPVQIFVRNLAARVDERMLREHFSTCGKVLTAKVMRLPDGSPKGFGFVTMGSRKEAEVVLADLNGSFWLGKCLYVALARNEKDGRPVPKLESAKRLKNW